MSDILKRIPRAIKTAIVARRQSKRTPEDVFTEIYKKRYWGGNDDCFSGYGSHVQPAIDAYTAALSDFARMHPNIDAVDIGCGDFNIGKATRHLFGRYVACDVVPHLVERNRLKFPNVEFRQLDITSEYPPSGDVALVRQVLQHLSNSQISAALNRLSKFKFLIVTEHLPLGSFIPNSDKPQGAGVRAHQIPPSGVDIAAAPFTFRSTRTNVLSELRTDEQIQRTTLYEI